MCCSIVGLFGIGCLYEGLTSFLKILSWKNLRVVGKENGMVSVWGNPICGTCKYFLRVGKISVAELVRISF